MRVAPVAVALIILLLCCGTPALGTEEEYRPNRYGIGLLAGRVYDPDHFGLAIIQGQMLVDYDRVFWYRAPDELWLKLEANLGMTTDGRDKRLASINMLAFYYLDDPAPRNWTPYIEAGIGLIYTGYRVKDQGLHFNFNPQAGAGIEFAMPNDQAMTLAFRLHHLSNGHLYKDNRGVNAALIMIGYLF